MKSMYKVARVCDYERERERERERELTNVT